MDLFIFAIGGNAGKSNIEVHDIQFVVAEKPEDAPGQNYERIGLVIRIKFILMAMLVYIGLMVTKSVSQKSANTPSAKKLYFVNVGAYNHTELAELHAFDFFVADNAAEAKEKALRSLLSGEDQQHKDNLKDVDDCKVLSQIDEYYIHLEPQKKGNKFIPEWQGYQPIGIS